MQTERGDMNQIKPDEVFQWRIDQWFPDFDKVTLAKLRKLHTELMKMNKTADLISAKTAVVADALHFADSILASRIIMRSYPKISSITDFGSGAGFPGLILAIIYPNIQVTLTDGDQKKCEFLNHMVQALGLTNAKVIFTSIDKMPDNSIEYAICRGFLSITKTLLLSRKIVKKGGQVFHLKGEEWGVEVSEMPSQICSVWSPKLVGEYRLPVGEIRFSVVGTEKINN